MTDQPQTPAAQGTDQGAVPSRVVITFPRPGAADCEITTEGLVTPGQLMVAAWWLPEWFRRNLVVPAAAGPRIVTADHLPPGGRRQ